MIVLDTNVLSGVMRPEPDRIVVAWLDRQPSESLWTTAVTVFEIRFGLELLARGRRRRQLEDAFARAIEEDFQGRVLSFDEEAARAWAGAIVPSPPKPSVRASSSPRRSGQRSRRFLAAVPPWLHISRLPGGRGTSAPTCPIRDTRHGVSGRRGTDPPGLTEVCSGQ
jgi:hypothetical protein